MPTARRAEGPQIKQTASRLACARDMRKATDRCVMRALPTLPASRVSAGLRFPCGFGSRGLSELSSTDTARLCRGASRMGGRGGRAVQKGCDVVRLHSPYFLPPRNRLGNWLDSEFSL